MVSMEIQNLRVYERRGLVAPDRTPGGSRLYSPDDIDRLNRCVNYWPRDSTSPASGRWLPWRAGSESWKSACVAAKDPSPGDRRHAERLRGPSGPSE
jgi:hypothetical protein